MAWEHETFQTGTAVELSRLCLGQLLGEGAFRRVHVWQPDKTLVVKFELQSQDFHNVFEWETWRKAIGTPLERWLAPVVEISPCGTILLQKRTEPIQTQREMPKRIPALFKDVKASNWGRLGKRIVCHDYGLIEFWRSKTPKEQMELVEASW